jgi:hypothetical protein
MRDWGKPAATPIFHEFSSLPGEEAVARDA